jgi:hypothetical protein
LELLEDEVTKRRNLIDIAAAEGLISDEQWQAQSALLVAYYEAEKTRITDEETKKRYDIAQVYRKLDLNSARTFLGYMSQLMNTKSKELFEIGKAAAIAGAIIDTYKAATGAYAALSMIPIVGPALGAAAAAAAIAAGIANVEQIRSQKIGGGAATPTFAASPTTGLPSGSPGAVPALGGGDNQAGTRTVILELRGPTFMREFAREMVETFNEEVLDGSIRLVTK